MIDLYLRADTEAVLAAALPWLRSTDPETEAEFWLRAGTGFAFDPIGPITTTPGTYDEEGEEITPPVVDTRFHANLRCVDQALAADVPEELLVTPESPKRAWL